jgi:hypothetical protein
MTKIGSWMFTLIVSSVIAELHALNDLHIWFFGQMGCGISHGALNDVELVSQVEILLLRPKLVF